MPPVARGDVIEVDIASLATGGRGLARLDNFVVFVERALPGDRVRARVTRSKGRYAEAETVERLVSGGSRVAAPCTHIDVCGGVRFQDYAYEKQLEHKTALVRDAMERIAQLPATLLPMIPAPDLFHYRNKMEFSFSSRTENGALLAVGLHVRGRFDRVFDLERCYLATPAMNLAVSELRRLALRDQVPA